ncbi:hypothetical protein Psyaliredsea_26130 [Psychrobacter alimentarius]
MIEQNTAAHLNDGTTPPPEKLLSKSLALIQLIVFSTIGLVMFFVPFTIGEKARSCSIMARPILSISSTPYLSPCYFC